MSNSRSVDLCEKIERVASQACALRQSAEGPAAQDEAQSVIDTISRVSQLYSHIKQTLPYPERGQDFEKIAYTIDEMQGILDESI